MHISSGSVSRAFFVLLIVSAWAVFVFASARPSIVKSYSHFNEIPGAHAVGTDTCTACHDDVAKDYRHAYHAQQGVQCEDCHGQGSLHADGGGDVKKIVVFRQRAAYEANGVCLSCHAKDERIRNWMAGSHASNKIRCIDCHDIHNPTKPGTKENVSLNVLSPAHAFAAENLVPETKTMMQSKWDANDACLKCHQTERGQMSLPYHHPLREGKMSCADCHDPHGGPGGKNLRSANINELCLSCHAQYRGPFAYQHPPVSENCMFCHTPHGSPNTNLLSVSEPALCLQCHASHHNGAGLPLDDRCTNCHGSIHGTDVPTPSGGSRFVDKGPSEALLVASARSGMAVIPSHAALNAAPMVSPLSSHSPSYLAGAAGVSLGAFSQVLSPLGRGGMADSGSGSGESPLSDTASAYSLMPGSYRFVDQTGYGGRVGEYDSLEQSAGADAATSYVNMQDHLIVVSRANVLTGNDYQAASQIAVGQWVKLGLDLRSFVQQQDHYQFYAFPVLDIVPGDTLSGDATTDLIPSHPDMAVTRRLGKAYAQVKVPKWPVHLFVKGDWQARSGTTQLAYLDENNTPAVYVGGVNTTCGAQCHYNSQYQPVNYTTRNVAGGADVDLGPVRLTYQHAFSSFNDRLVFPTGTFTGPFTPETEGISILNPPPIGPAPPDVAPGNYPIDIPSPSQANSDRLSLNWVASKLTFNGNIAYTRLSDLLTNHQQNAFASDDTLFWRPLNRLQITADYHQQNQLNDFIPYYSMYGNPSYHRHWEELRADYELGNGFDAEVHYKRSGITRSNAALWPQIYSMDNTDLLTVVPSSFSNTTGAALRYRAHGLWSARAGYEWTGTHDPGYLIVPRSNNRITSNFTFTPRHWFVFTNDANLILQNAFASVALPNTPGDFQRRNRFYFETASATVQASSNWNLGLGYSYQQNNLTTYMAFQNDSGVNYVIDQPAVPYKQISQTYWGDSSYTFGHRLGLTARVTYNSARSGFRPDVNPADAALLGNQSLITAGTFDPVMFGAALNNLTFSSTQVSQVIVPQWIGQSKAYYLFPNKFEGGVIFYYGSYRDYWNPNVNGVLRTFDLYVGRTW